MKVELERVAPMEIEERSFELIERELPHPLDPALAPIIKRVIHATADFDYADSLCFTEGAVDAGQDALRRGAVIVTDTTMAQAGLTPRPSSPLSTIPRQSHSSKNGAKILTHRKLIQSVPCVMLVRASSSHAGMSGM